MIQRVVEEFERRSVNLAPQEETEIRSLLLKYEPVLHFQAGERFFPTSAILYLLFSTIWYLPLKSREGEDIVDSPFSKRAMPGLFELLRCRPHIQLNTEVDQEDFGGAPASDRYIRIQHAQRKLAQAKAPTSQLIKQARRMLESRIRRFRSAWLNPGMLFLHFSETIAPWDRSLLRHWFLPRDTDTEASRKYDKLTLADGKRETCYYGRVVDQCGYRVIQYWFFYPFNDFRTAVRGMNNHEGDWERICIYLAQEGSEWRPKYAAYSGHHTKQAHPWEEIEFADEAHHHPAVYVARGSHACYFHPGDYQLFGIGPFKMYDHAAGDGEEISLGKWGTLRLLTETEPDWLFFDGFWGAYIRDLLMRENAPRGPLYTIEPGFHRPVPRETWYEPIKWAGLECTGGPGCDHKLHGHYGYTTAETAWQEDWGSDEEWDEWARTADFTV
ncbi:MAG: hypothetical protein AB8I69_17945 [Anaerolineae bacterium]|jgi:hypothetical protein